MTFDFTPLRQSLDRLIDDRLINTGGQVLFIRALVDQRLDIRLGEHAAAGGDRVDLFSLFGGFVHFFRA